MNYKLLGRSGLRVSELALGTMTFFGLIAVTQAALPIMRLKKQGRIINMSSISGRLGFPG